jgi:hypothetical protein
LGGGGGGSAPPWYYNPTPPEGGGGAGSGESDPIFTEDPPCPNCPVDGFDPGDNTNPTDEPPGVILDPSIDNPANKKIKCVWDKLKQIPAFKALLIDFGNQINSYGLKLTLKVADLGDKMTGATSPYKIVSHLMTVEINSRLVLNSGPLIDAGEGTHIAIAATIIHEILHARLLAKIWEQGGWNAVTSVNPPPLDGLSEIYDECFDAFDPQKDDVKEMTLHEYMARYEVDLLAQILAEYDNHQEPNTNKYKAIALVGLERTNRYSGNSPTSLGYSDPFMDINKRDLAKQLCDARKQDPCN